jgi:hypothetical protein
MGGFADVSFASVEVYTPSTNEWTPVAPMPTARHAFAAVTGPDGRICAIGGKNKFPCFATSSAL